MIRELLKGRTVLRSIINLHCRTMPVLEGRILDVGGTRTPPASYLGYLHLSEGATIVTLNIDAQAHPDILADATAIPIADASVDTALCFNLLEHVSEPDRVLGEIARVLKPGSLCLMETPFLINIHGHPDDFFRFTNSALRRMSERAGLQVASLTALGGGPFLASLSVIQPFIHRWIFPIPFLIARLLDAVIMRLRPAWSERWPLGYFLVCQKPIR